MLGPADFALAGLLPGLVALALRQVLLRAGAGDRFAWPLATSLAFLVGWLGLEAQGGAGSLGEWAGNLPKAVALIAAPRQASHWLPLAGLLAAVVGILLAGSKRLAIAGCVLGGLLSVALPTRLLWGSVYFLSEWSAGDAVARVGLLAVTFLGVGWAISRSRDEESAPTVRAGLLAVVGFGLAVVLATSGSLSYARLAGVGVAAIVGATLGGLRIPNVKALGSGVSNAGPVVTAVLGGLIVLGFFYAEITPLNAALLTTSLAVAGATGGWAPTIPWRAAALRVALCLIPLGAAATRSGLDFAEAISQKPDNPYANWQPPD